MAGEFRTVPKEERGKRKGRERPAVPGSETMETRGKRWRKKHRWCGRKKARQKRGVGKVEGQIRQDGRVWQVRVELCVQVRS
mmetsp:Transcript_19001/g.43280  ORF Transcript_19001/g.43280 Transcript_19001/m.43280 type:complete len:82 (+) Transcript_19001:323-568(+)